MIDEIYAFMQDMSENWDYSSIGSIFYYEQAPI